MLGSAGFLLIRITILVYLKVILYMVMAFCKLFSGFLMDFVLLDLNMYVQTYYHLKMNGSVE